MLVAPAGSLPTRGRLFSVSKRLGGENRVPEAPVGGWAGARRASLQLGRVRGESLFPSAWPWDLASEQLSAWGRGGGVSALREGFLEVEAGEALELNCQVWGLGGGRMARYSHRAL